MAAALGASFAFFCSPCSGFFAGAGAGAGAGAYQQRSSAHIRQARNAGWGSLEEWLGMRKHARGLQ